MQYQNESTLVCRPSKRRHIKAYSLVEIMVVVLLLAMLSALLLPIMQSSKDTAKLAVCTMNLKQIYNGLMSQAVDSKDGMMPPDPYQWEFYAESLVESEVMICPIEIGGDQHFKVDEQFEFLPEPPPDLLQGTMESDSKVIVFREQAAMTLPADIQVINEIGRYGRGNSKPEYCTYNTQATLPAGTLMDVYYFSFDPATKNNEGNEGEIWFSTNDTVLGFVGKKSDLNKTDNIVGLKDYAYPQSLGCRGVDVCTAGKWGDSVELTSHRRSIIHQFSHASTTCKDDFRAFVTAGSGSSYAMNVEVAKHPSSEKQLLIADSKVPWINFTGGVDTNDFEFSESVDARHFGKVNTLAVDGTVELFTPESIQPDSVLWRK